MKLTLFCLLSLFTTNLLAHPKCNKSVDPRRVVLFVDSNQSKLEIETAAKAACARGESFKVLPEKDSYVSATNLEMELTKLAKNNIAISSMIVSGHNGGGQVHGLNGGIDKTEIIAAMKSAYKSKPNLLAQFNSVFMWGCWTMGPSEVDVWRKELPSLKMTAGFFDMGPLNTTVASRTVLHDLLVKEKSISAEADKEKVKRAIASVSNINQTWAAVYTESCGNNLYYYRTNGDSAPDPDDVNYKSGVHFVDYDKAFSCDGVNAEFNSSLEELMKYFRGDIPVPTNTTNNPLRRIYSFVRTHAKCIKPNHVMNGDRILMLIFEKEVKKNFSSVFGDVVSRSKKEFDHLKSFLAKFNPKGNDMKAFKKYFQDGQGHFFDLDAKTLQSKSRKEIRNMISYLDGLTKQSIVKKDPKFAKNLQSLKMAKNAMETYLYQMNPNCMDFLEWHEYSENYKPQAYCPI